MTAWVRGASYLLAFPREGALQDTPAAGVAAKGPAQYNVKWDKYAEYYKRLFQKIEVTFKIRSLMNYRRPLILASPRAVTVAFRALRSGELVGVKVLSDGGLPIVASDIAEGVQAASPVEAFPDYVKEGSLNIQLKCYLE